MLPQQSETCVMQTYQDSSDQLENRAFRWFNDGLFNTHLCRRFNDERWIYRNQNHQHHYQHRHHHYCQCQCGTHWNSFCPNGEVSILFCGCNKKYVTTDHDNNKLINWIVSGCNKKYVTTDNDNSKLINWTVSNSNS